MLDRPAPVKQSTRAILVEAARRCFVRNGFYETTVEDVVRESGIARSTFYRHVRNLDDLLIPVAEMELIRVFSLATSAVDRTSHARDQLTDAMIYIIERPTDWLQKFGLEQDMIKTTNLIYASAPDLLERVGVCFYPIIDEGRRNGELRNDVSNAEVVEWLVQNTWNLRYIHRSRSDASLRDRIIKFIIPAIVAHPSNG